MIDHIRAIKKLLKRLLQNLSVSAEILPWSTLGAFFRIDR